MIFKYEAYNYLLAELGRLDYVVEISEISVKDFLKKMDQSNDPGSYLKEKSNEFGIMVSFDPSNNYYNQIALGNISNVYHLGETFFYELQAEFNSISNEDWKFEQGKTKLDQVISFLKGLNRINNTDQIDDYLINIFAYYHQLRVYFSHKKTTSKGEIHSKYENAIKHFDIELMKRYKVKNSPKKLQEIDFEDYFLFTQITKDLALKISSIGYPKPKGLADLKEIRRMKKFKDNSVRLNKSIENALITKYSFIKENDSDTLVEQIISHI
ncbi:MAG: hypothetical protein JXR36_02755 [Bacteroidales bacterium]|nr:hypothetical protein [Bacteroidales bacterium]